MPLAAITDGLSFEKGMQAKSTIQDDTKPNIGSQIKKQGITLRANDIRQAEKGRKVKKKEKKFKLAIAQCTVLKDFSQSANQPTVVEQQ